MKIIVVANQKGGVGKTTTTVNLAHGLAKREKNTLIVDFDPQGHAATALGLKSEPGAFYLLTMGTGAQENVFLRQFIRNSGRDHLSIIAGDRETSAAQIMINAKDQPVSWVRSALERFNHNDLDYILVDTSPSVGGIQERALWAADLVIVPTGPEYLSTDSVRKTIEMMEALKNQKGWRGHLLGILPTMLQDQLREHRASLEDLQKRYADLILPAIHRAAVVAECPGEACTIFEKDPGSRAAQEYEELVKLVLKYTR
jgi:chromosome partitioning protein